MAKVYKSTKQKESADVLQLLLFKMNRIEEIIINNPDYLVKNPLDVSPSQIVWTSSKTDLIELIYALHAAGVCNYGKVRIKQLVAQFEACFGLQLGNTSLRFQEILRRKDSAAFLHQLSHKLDLYITQIDENRV